MKLSKGMLVVVMVVAPSLTGCQDQPVQSVEWYVAHGAERKAMVEKCRAMPKAQSAANENCAHAVEAVRKADTDAPRWVPMN